MSDMTRHCPLCGDFARRAEKAEADLAALRAETADLHEIERCKRSIITSGCRIVFNPDGRWLVLTGSYGGKKLAQTVAPSVTDWQFAERAAWEHAAEPYRKRIEAAWHELQLRYGKPDFCPVTVYEGAAHRYATGYHGGYPTLDALEQAAKWAEEHPADAPEPDRCDCGHEHQGCVGCAYKDNPFAQEPCRRCHVAYPQHDCKWEPTDDPANY